jgi:hypothetical protein
VHRSPIHRTTGDVAPVYIVGWYGGYGLLPPLHSYKSGMQRADGTPYPPYYPAMYTGATVPPLHRTTGATVPPVHRTTGATVPPVHRTTGATVPPVHRTTGVTGGPVIHRHRCMPNSRHTESDFSLAIFSKLTLRKLYFLFKQMQNFMLYNLYFFMRADLFFYTNDKVEMFPLS